MLKSIATSLMVFGLATVANAEEETKLKLRTAKELSQTTQEQQDALTEAFRVLSAYPGCGIRIVITESGGSAVLPDESPACLAAQAKK